MSELREIRSPTENPSTVQSLSAEAARRPRAGELDIRVCWDQFTLSGGNISQPARDPSQTESPATRQYTLDPKGA